MNEASHPVAGGGNQWPFQFRPRLFRPRLFRPRLCEFRQFATATFDALGATGKKLG